jgi:hypothetical protein
VVAMKGNSEYGIVYEVGGSRDATRSCLFFFALSLLGGFAAASRFGIIMTSCELKLPGGCGKIRSERFMRILANVLRFSSWRKIAVPYARGGIHMVLYNIEIASCENCNQGCNRGHIKPSTTQTTTARLGTKDLHLHTEGLLP